MEYCCLSVEKQAENIRVVTISIPAWVKVLNVSERKRENQISSSKLNFTVPKTQQFFAAPLAVQEPGVMTATKNDAWLIALPICSLHTDPPGMSEVSCHSSTGGP
jgi:hypothetical protein